MRSTKVARTRRLVHLRLAQRIHDPARKHIWQGAHRMSFALLLLCALLTPASIASAGSARSASPTPTSARPMIVDARPLTLASLANAQIAQMSLDDELGQLFIPTFLCCGYTRATAIMVEQLHIGGAILYAANTSNAARTHSLIAAAQANAPIPLLVTLDEEGGGVDRLRAIFGPSPSARQIALTHSTAYAYEEGARTAREMASLGFNVNLAPDVDVQLVAGPDLGSRN